MTQDNNANKPTDNAGQNPAVEFLKDKDYEATEDQLTLGYKYYEKEDVVKYLTDFASLVAEERCREKEFDILHYKAALKSAEYLLEDSEKLCNQYRQEKEGIQAHRNDLAEQLEIRDKQLEEVKAKADKLVGTLNTISRHLKNKAPVKYFNIHPIINIISAALTAHQEQKQEGETK